MNRPTPPKARPLARFALFAVLVGCDGSGFQGCYAPQITFSGDQNPPATRTTAALVTVVQPASPTTSGDDAGLDGTDASVDANYDSANYTVIGGPNATPLPGSQARPAANAPPGPSAPRNDSSQNYASAAPPSQRLSARPPQQIDAQSTSSDQPAGEAGSDLPPQEPPPSDIVVVPDFSDRARIDERQIAKEPQLRTPTPAINLRVPPPPPPGPMPPH